MLFSNARSQFNSINKINNTELMLFNCDLAFENNISDAYSEPHSAYA